MVITLLEILAGVGVWVAYQKDSALGIIFLVGLLILELYKRKIQIKHRLPAFVMLTVIDTLFVIWMCFYFHDARLIMGLPYFYIFNYFTIYV